MLRRVIEVYISKLPDQPMHLDPGTDPELQERPCGEYGVGFAHRGTRNEEQRCKEVERMSAELI